MNVLPDQEQLAIQRAIAEFLQAEVGPAEIRRSELGTSPGYSPILWRKLAVLGWLTLCIPERYGGQGLPLTHLCLVFEECGRHIAPLPLHATLVAALVLARHGTPRQCEILERVGSGDLVMSFAVSEASGAWKADHIELQGRCEGDHIILQGSKSFVDQFSNAEQCLVTCSLDDGRGGAAELAAVLVDVATPGIGVEKLVSMNKDAQSNLTFDNARVPAANIIGVPGRRAAAVDDLMDLAAVLLVPLMQGAARQAMEIAVAYVNQREAFGQPIGAFQAIQHMAADMLNAVDGSQLLAREALWRMSNGLSAGVEVSQAKAFANEKCLMVCRCAQQMHGGLGFIVDCDINLWYRKVASWSLLGGTVYEHRERVASALLDARGEIRLDMAPQLPRQTLHTAP